MDERVYELAERAQSERLQQAIDSRVRYQGESAAECDECGTVIPEARRAAIPGVRLCVECQRIAEIRR